MRAKGSLIAQNMGTGEKMDDTPRYIMAIAEKGSISKAAEAVHMSQSALSQRLKNEESVLGVELFDRTHTPLRPTYAGTLYLEWAKSVIRAENTLLDRLSQVSEGEWRVLNIGISSARYADLLAGVTAQFVRENSNCRINFVEVGKRELINDAFARNAIDFSVLTPQQPEPSLYSSRPLCVERYVYVAPKTWDVPFRQGEDGMPVVDAETIARYPFIMPRYANRTTAIVEALYELASSRPRVIINCAGAPMLTRLVARGAGGSIVGTAAERISECDDLAYYNVEGIAGPSYLYYSSRRDVAPSDDETAYVGLVKDELRRRGLFIERI